MRTICLSAYITRWRSFIITTLFCLLVAFTSFNVWGGSVYIHLLTSLGYGYSAIISSTVLERLFPNITSLLETVISLVCSIILGSFNAWFWLNSYLDGSFLGFLPVIMSGGIFSMMCFYYFYNREQQAIAEKLLEEAKRKQAEQEKALILSQLMQMQSQIEPHFLFNTLANISALMSQDVPKARMMLDKLTELLRTTLANSRLAETTVEDEIRRLNAYLAIQKIRLDERLHFHIDVDPQLQQTVIPPMLIQPLVENAIQHGIEPKGVGGTIHIAIFQANHQLKIKVTDDGIGLRQNAQTKGHGVGLTNIKQRVKGLYEQQGSVAIIQPDQGGFSVCITIPLDAQAIEPLLVTKET
ncbi:histidine kinase [Vibrio sp. 404]|uniref:Histidine kinase n=1 Tax=Vibrio marinisediminis TaxID=2758441 RepID=A0A7W2IT16_9VIBR|nr:histidine kinase [Vibrio marinisediminis]MBA5761693.1 histidine kinase [Vibrio marinisediminis]